MKKFLSLLSLAFIVQTNVNATVRTLNNNNPSPGQFSLFSAAVTASVNGDTIYVSGSATSYGTQLISKQLTIIGTGHNPNKQNPLVSTFDYIDCGLGSSGSKFIGLNFFSILFINTSNITYESCKFSFGGPYILATPVTGINFNKCIFLIQAIGTNSSSPVLGTLAFNNCIFNNGINISPALTLSGSANNCLFLSSSLGSVSQNFNNFSFNNNIFYGTSPQITGTNTNTTMTKNISFACPNNAFNGTTLSGNIVNSNPLFTTYPLTNGFHYTDNYVLQAGSPGKNTGSDGKDIGLYGGTDGINFRMGGDPAIPQIRQMNVTNSVLPAGTPVNVNIISTRKN